MWTDSKAQVGKWLSMTETFRSSYSELPVYCDQYTSESKQLFGFFLFTVVRILRENEN